MRKKIAVWMMLNFFLATLIAMSSIDSAEAGIETPWIWVGPQYDDAIWGTDIIAFTEGSTATLLVTVKNDYANRQLNVSAVKVRLDWNINYSSTEASETTPLVIPPSSWVDVSQYYTFTISFTVPSTSTASNLFQHHYWIYVEEVNATIGPKTVTTHDVDIGSDFVVYSVEQFDAQMLRQEINRIFAQYPNTGYLDSYEADMLWDNATMEKNVGDENYEGRDFVGAKTHYQTALNLLNQMLTVEKSYQTRVQENSLRNTEANINYYEAQASRDEAYASYYEAQANYSKMQANYSKMQASMYEAQVEAQILRDEAYTSMYEAQATYYEAQATYYSDYYRAYADYYAARANATTTETDATMKQANADMIAANAASIQAYSWIIIGIGVILLGVAASVYARKPKPSS